LVAQGGIEALVIGASPRVGLVMGDVAQSHGVHVWRPPPLGRNFSEAIEIARQLRDAEIAYRVGSWWEHVADDIRWAMDFEDGFKPIVSELHVSAAGPELSSWRSTLASAGGGVLAYDAYPLLEALVELRGLPESVTGVVGWCRRRKEESPRETEDLATAIMRFSDGGLAHLRATWDIPPLTWASHHHSSSASIRYSDTAVAILGPDGEPSEEHPLPAGGLEAEMVRFAAEIRDETRRGANGVVLDRHLMIAALLEATYLSARTEHPELPRRLFEVQKWPEPQR